VSQRLQACCCESNPCQGPFGSCCFPDGSCRNVACAHYCSQQGGIFRPNVQCSGNPCVPPTQKCNCDDATWRKVNLWVSIVRIWTHTIILEADSSVPPDLYSKQQYTLFYVTSYNVTQARIDAGEIPPIPLDNPIPAYSFGTSYFKNGQQDVTSILTVQEFRLDQQCCQNVSQTFTVNGPDDYYYDAQGNSEGPYPTSWSVIESESAYYCCPGFGFCYDCCCQRIPTACAQVGTC